MACKAENNTSRVVVGVTHQQLQKRGAAYTLYRSFSMAPATPEGGFWQGPIGTWQRL
jgi:hypothetical protein